MLGNVNRPGFACRFAFYFQQPTGKGNNFHKQTFGEPAPAAFSLFSATELAQEFPKWVSQQIKEQKRLRGYYVQ